MQSFSFLSLSDVSSWSTADVCAWLSYIHLDQYVDSFFSNDIAGHILLELSLEDLDYLGVTALGHRKILLKSVEQFRQTGQFSSETALRASPSKAMSKSVEVIRYSSPCCTYIMLLSFVVLRICRVLLRMRVQQRCQRVLTAALPRLLLMHSSA